MSARLAMHGQRGAALVVALVVLVLVTIIAVAASQRALVDEKGARAARDREIALQAAEAAVRDAMIDIDTGPREGLFSDAPVGFDAQCPNEALPGTGALATSRRGLCLASDPAQARQSWQDVDFAARAVPFGTFTGRAWNVAQAPAPRYIVEWTQLTVAGEEVQSTATSSQRVAFRITAVGYGPPGSNVETSVQTFYVKIR